MTNTVWRILRYLAAAVVLTAAAGCGSGDTGEQSGEVTGTITVFAAASLTETFTTLGEQFEQAHPDTDVVFSFGGSSTLAEQLRQGVSSFS